MITVISAWCNNRRKKPNETNISCPTAIHQSERQQTTEECKLQPTCHPQARWHNTCSASGSQFRNTLLNVVYWWIHLAVFSSNDFALFTSICCWYQRALMLATDRSTFAHIARSNTTANICFTALNYSWEHTHTHTHAHAHAHAHTHTHTHTRTRTRTRTHTDRLVTILRAALSGAE